MVSPIDSSKTPRTGSAKANKSGVESLNVAFEKAKNMYINIVGKNAGMEKIVSNSAAVNRIFQDIGYEEAAIGFRSRVLPQKHTEKPAPQTRLEFKNRLETAERTGKRKEDLVVSDDAENVITGYYLFVKSALYGGIELPDVKMPHLFGDSQYDTPKTIGEKVVLNPEEKQNFEGWLNSGEISHAVWDKVKFALGVTDSWSRFNTGGKDDAQLNAYRTAMAEKGCEVLKLVCESEEYVPLVLAWAKAEEIATKITGKPPKITQFGYIENTK